MASQACCSSDHKRVKPSEESSAVLLPHIFATNIVPSEARYLRSWSAVEGTGFGVLGGRIEGCWLGLPLGLIMDPFRGVPNIRDVRGTSASVGTVEMYVASSDTCTCAKISSNTWGGRSELSGFSKTGCLIHSTKKDCNCSSANLLYEFGEYENV